MRRGFTLIEITIVIALMAIFITVYFLAANPGGQLAQARNSERLSHLQAILNYIEQDMADNNGLFVCSVGTIPTSTSRMTSDAGSGNYNIGPCLIPTYMGALPFDPVATGGRYVSASNYDTGYSISMNASGTLTLSAPYAELGITVSVLK